MSYAGPRLSDLELRYPFAPRSRKFFESVPVEEGLASREVMAQTETRLLSSLGRSRYDVHMSELVEFSSFFASALVASQDPVLATRFSRKEAERSKEYFVKETPDAKAVVMNECFGAAFSRHDRGDGRPAYELPFEVFLTLVSKYDLVKDQKWKLARQELSSGKIHFSDNLLNDFFGECARVAIADGVRNLRKAPFPKQLGGVRANVLQYVPTPKPRTGKGYEYVEDLLKHPVSDGRHRLTWLVLAPYLVNVKKLEDDDAIEKIRAFVAVAGETGDLKRFVEYNVRRARRNGLLPPRFSTLRTEHPDIYGLLPKEVIAADPSAKGKTQKQGQP